MKLPELPPNAENQWHHVDDLREYGESCYAKGRADLLKEIGEPVAWMYEAEFSSGSYSPNYFDWRVTLTEAAAVGRKVIPLYVLPKEKP